MNEHQITDYVALLNKLLNCQTDEESLDVLQANLHLVDEVLVLEMTQRLSIINKQDNQMYERLKVLVEPVKQLCWGQINKVFLRFYQNGNYSQAIIFAKQALDYANRCLGISHPLLATSKNNLAAVHEAQGHYDKAETLYNETLKLRQEILGANHPNIAKSLNNLAALYKLQGRYSEAEVFYQKALDLWEIISDAENVNVAASLNNLGLLHFAQGRYTKAENLYKKALKIWHNLLEEEHPDVITALNNLAQVYEVQGRYGEAEDLYSKTLEQRRRVLGKNHPDVASTINNIAGVYKDQGRYSEAENFYLQALDMRKRLLGDEHPNLVNTINNLSGLYVAQGRYSEAENFYLQALDMRKRLLGDEHPDVAVSLNNLAGLYNTQGQNSKAEACYEQALSISFQTLGENHPNCADIINNLAGVYKNQCRYSEAERLYTKALKMRKIFFGLQHPDVAGSLNNLATLYKDRGHYMEAEHLYIEALTMYKHFLGNKKPNISVTLNGLTTVLAATARQQEALLTINKAIVIDDEIANNIFSFSSENDRLAYLKKIRINFCGLLSIVYNSLSNSPEAIKSAYDLILKRKALATSALTAQNEALYSDRYPHLTEDFHKLRDLSEQIIHLTFTTPQTEDFTTYQQQLAQLQSEHNSLQKHLASQVPEIQLQELLANYSDVASELPAESILIEFVRFDVFNFKAIPAQGEAQWQPSRYLAFILPAGQPESVEMIDIGETEHIDSLIREFRELVSGTGKNTESQLGMFSKRPPKLIFREYHPQAGIKLRQAIFDKLRPYLQEDEHLIIAPDGELNLVPFQILPSDDTGEKMLMDEFTISYLTVGRDIMRQKIETKRSASLNALVFASPNFDLSTESVTPDEAPEQNILTTNLRECIANNPLKPAVGTNILGERVAQRFKVASYLGNEALESYFKSFQCPRILLLATHGVFLASQPEDRSQTFPDLRETDLLQRDCFFGRVENPMLRSALALAGANTWAKGGKLSPEAGKGILFAQDVAGLDLWANEITVLSACETAIGDVAIGEGVFGLRRAFAVAGTKTLIMSLWSVNGWTTALLMERFFDNCEAGNGRAAALQEAQNYVRNITVGELQQFELGREILKYEFNNGRELDTAILARQAEDQPLTHPYYWGAWICQGNTTPLPFTACS